MVISKCFGKTESRINTHDSCLIPCPNILSFSSYFQLSTFVPTVLCLFNNLSPKKYNYLSNLSLKCTKLLQCPMCSQASSLMGWLLIAYTLLFVYFAPGTYSLHLMAPCSCSGARFPDPCCLCNSQFCRYLLYLPIAISFLHRWVLAIQCCFYRKHSLLLVMLLPFSDPFLIMPYIIMPYPRKLYLSRYPINLVLYYIFSYL